MSLTVPPNGASERQHPHRPNSWRQGARAPLAVLVLGVLSALALLGASAIDYGDPRVEARANARAAVETRTEKALLRWSEWRTAPEAPPGAGHVYSPPSEPLEVGAFGVPGRAARPADAVFEVLVDVAQAALQRGDGAAALSALEDALAEAPLDTQRREEALYAAARAASVLGRSQDVERYRGLLLAAQGDAMVAGTSVKLLVHWIKPLDGDGAHGLLGGVTPLLPAPKDAAKVEGGGLVVALDPWWGALAKVMAEARPDLDWDQVWQRPGREAAAVGELVRSRGLSASDRWVLSMVDGALLGLRRGRDTLEIAALDRGAFEGMWSEPARPGDPIGAELILGEPGAAGAVALPGTPYALRMTHRDPEGSARAQVRRIQWLRAGLVGLSVLVLLAAALSYRAMSRSRRLAELRSTFVASVSHDLRTPTQAILLMSEMLEDDLVPEGASKREYQSQIRREAQRLRRLVEDLLDGGRIDRGGGARIVRGDVASGPFFDELERAMEERVRDASATLCVTRGALPGVLHVDGDGVHRVLWNLFENALLHGRLPGGAADVSIHVGWADGILTCTVSDGGPGIAERHRETVFGAFERLGDRAKRAGGIESDTGTGLGLAIVQAIARAHGGDATVESGEGQGARFVVTFDTESSEGDLV